MVASSSKLKQQQQQQQQQHEKGCKAPAACENVGTAMQQEDVVTGGRHVET
jgi:hypothetical protein